MATFELLDRLARSLPEVEVRFCDEGLFAWPAVLDRARAPEIGALSRRLRQHVHSDVPVRVGFAVRT